MGLTSSHHPTDDTRTGDEIARAALTSLGIVNAHEVIAAMRGGAFPLTIVQTGHFTRLLTAAERLTAQNAELRAAVETLKAALELDEGRDSDLASD